MARFADCKWRVGYSSDEDDLIEEFYEPALSLAKSYDRAVGYFSSQSLALIGSGIRMLYLRNGRMRLIASPVMSVEDREAIRRGHVARDQLIETRLLDYLDPWRLSEDEQFRLQLLTGMIADGLLQVRIAVKLEDNGSLNLYHEKIGVFVDDADDFMTFIGSPNETWNGWVGNAESFALHTSWGSAADHAAHERALFERTWNEKRPRVPVYDLPHAVREALFERFPPRPPETTAGVRRGANVRMPKEARLGFPPWLDNGRNLRDYQKDAVNRWLEANGRGIFAMATGTGKTLTALAATIQLIKALRRSSLFILVIVPSRDLVTQWQANAEQFGFAPVTCHSGTSARWPDELAATIQHVRFGAPAVEMAITTADTLLSPRCSEAIARCDCPMLIIADEVHSMGTRRRLAELPNAQYRLGLSATPRRHGDERGTHDLLEYFGGVRQRIGIREAIDLKALVPYSYIPVMVPLAEDEMHEYRALSARIATAFATAEVSQGSLDRANQLLYERSRLLGHAVGKIPALERLMRPLSGTTHNLVYVAEGAHPIHGTRQLDATHHLLGIQLDMAVNLYTAETPAPARLEYQSMLRDGRLQALIAMRCLDEGIDIPEARRGIILASTQNPRQFVQRRGRILRRDEANGKTSAELYDMFVVPEVPPPRSEPTFKMERKLVGRELSRALELASASTNGRDTPPAELVNIMQQYELLELVTEYLTPPDWDTGDSNVYEQ